MAAPKKAAKKKAAKRKPPKPPPSREHPQVGAGRPRKPPPIDDDKGDPKTAALRAEIRAVEVARTDATAAYVAEPTVARKADMLVAEMRVAEVYAAYCRAIGDYTHAIKYGELLAKFTARHNESVELMMYDKLDALESKTRRERAAARGS